jgi:hypothetical protein
MNTYMLHSKQMWLSFAQKLGKVNTILLLSVIYIVVIGFMALLVRVLRKDFLQKKIDKNIKSYWQTRVTSDQTLERSKYQF